MSSIRLIFTSKSKEISMINVNFLSKIQIRILWVNWMESFFFCSKNHELLKQFPSIAMKIWFYEHPPPSFRFLFTFSATAKEMKVKFESFLMDNWNDKCNKWNLINPEFACLNCLVCLIEWWNRKEILKENEISFYFSTKWHFCFFKVRKITQAFVKLLRFQK